jgi:hypothetical protein
MPACRGFASGLRFAGCSAGVGRRGRAIMSADSPANAPTRVLGEVEVRGAFAPASGLLLKAKVLMYLGLSQEP